MKKVKRNLLLVIGVAFLSLTAAGCGYTTRSAVNLAFKTIYVEPFKNKIDYSSEFSEARNIRTYFPLMETKISAAVVDRFLFDGNVKVVKEEQADAVLKGELVDYVRDVLRYDDNNNPLEYRINLVVKLTLRDQKQNTQLWEESRFVGDTTYFATGSAAKSEATAVNDAITDLARRIVERTVEQW